MPFKHYLLIYRVADDYLERRGAFRSVHLAHAWKAHEKGDLVLAGALTDPVDGAVLLFKGEDPGAAQAFAEQDPYVIEGIVESWEVREWTTVVGEDAANPIRPE